MLDLNKILEHTEKLLQKQGTHIQSRQITALATALVAAVNANLATIHQEKKDV